MMFSANSLESDVSPERRVLNTLRSLGVHPEFFEGLDQDMAIRLGDAMLKAVASELHPDRHPGSVSIPSINGVDLLDINFVRRLISGGGVIISDLPRLAGDYNVDALAEVHERNRLLEQQIETQRIISATLTEALIRGKDGYEDMFRLYEAVWIMTEGENKGVLPSRTIEVKMNNKGLVVEVYNDTGHEPGESTNRVLAEKVAKGFTMELENLFDDPVDHAGTIYFVHSDGRLFYKPKKTGEYIDTGLVISPDSKYFEYMRNNRLTGGMAKPKQKTRVIDGQETETPDAPTFTFGDILSHRNARLLKDAKFFGYAQLYSPVINGGVLEINSSRQRMSESTNDSFGYDFFKRELEVFSQDQLATILNCYTQNFSTDINDARHFADNYCYTIFERNGKIIALKNPQALVRVPI